MPEGDTVWLAAAHMHQALAGRRLTGCDFRVPRLATTDLTGRLVLAVLARGKHMLTRIEGGLTLHSHFRMDGSWHLYAPGDRWRGGPDWQVRAVLSNQEWVAVGYRLPVLELVATDTEEQVVGHLGPDLLGPDWDQAEALRRLLVDPDAEIGMALLEQRNLAGLGNLYRNEALFLAGLTPWLTVAQVPDLNRLVERSRRLMMANREHSAQSTTGSLRPGQEHWVYGRAGRPCRRCGATILATDQGVAPQARRTFWCPRCQLGPAPAGAGSHRAGRP